MTRFQADLLLVLAAVIWGIAFYFQKSAMAVIGPYLFVGLRGLIAAVTLVPFAAQEGQRSPGGWRGVVRYGLAGGVLFFAGAILQQTGLVMATITNAGFLTALYVVLTPLIVWALRRKAPSVVVWIAVGLAFGGTWALGGGTVGGLTLGDWLIAGSAVFWAFHLIVTEDAGRFARPVTFTAIQFAAVGILGIAGAAVLEPISWPAIQTALPALLYVGILSSAVTFTILSIATRYVPASEAAVLVSMETLVTAAAGYLLLHERLTPLGWVGAAMMLAAILVVQVRPKGRA